MQMLDEAVREFLRKPLISRISTNGANGYPHTAPTWYMMEGDDVVVMSERDTRKIKNLARDARAAVQVGGEPGDAFAVLFRGEFVVTDDVGHEVTNRITRHYEGDNADKYIAEWADFDMVVMRMTPTSAVVTKLSSSLSQA